ncbi:MAG: hypothetical protein Q9199_004908 [Rusavskia elegans]
MAALAFPNITTSAKLSSGVTYSYVHVQAKDSMPYLLLLHGFPSSAYDWRHQIEFFSDRGYGLIVPDLLGYGATDKPQEKEAYRLMKMCGEVVEILDIYGLEKVVGVGHDWGSFLLGRLANYHPARFSKFAFLDIAYALPNAEGFSVDPINEMTTQMIEYPVFGYWHFFKDEDSGDLMTDKMDHTIAVAYASSYDFSKDNLCYLGAARRYYTSGTPGPIAAWFADHEIEMHKKIFSKEQGGYGPPLNWYKCEIANLNGPDEAKVAKEDYYLMVPSLLVKCKCGPLGVPAVQEMGMKPWIEEELLTVVEIESGHWCLLEKPRETIEALERFFE